VSEWPWFACRQCAQLAPERCDAHAGGSPDETPYQTLTRWGSIEVVVRSEDVDAMRSAFRRHARADRLRIRTLASGGGGELSLVLAWLQDYGLTDEEVDTRMRRAMERLERAFEQSEERDDE
jgi:hypothetical protein